MSNHSAIKCSNKVDIALSCKGQNEDMNVIVMNCYIVDLNIEFIAKVANQIVDFEFEFFESSMFSNCF